MSDLEERRKTDIEEDHQAAKLKIVRDADGKSYGTLNEQHIKTNNKNTARSLECR